MFSAMIVSSVKKPNQYKNSYYIWNSYFRNSLLGLQAADVQFDLEIGVANVVELPRDNSKKYLFTYFLSVKTLPVDNSTGLRRSCPKLATYCHLLKKRKKI